jgi:hypothetical protein
MFQHVAAKALLPKAALLIWYVTGLRERDEKVRGR